MKARPCRLQPVIAIDTKDINYIVTGLKETTPLGGTVSYETL